MRGSMQKERELVLNRVLGCVGCFVDWDVAVLGEEVDCCCVNVC